MKFLLDENLSPLHARRLRESGWDAVSVIELGLSGADDENIRSAAIESARTLVTLDADFGNILRFPVDRTPGVIWLRLHPPSEPKIVRAIERMLEKLAAIGVSGKLVVVDEDKIRIRG